MAEDSRTVGSICGSSKKIAAAKITVRQIGPAAVQFDSVTSTTSDGGIHTNKRLDTERERVIDRINF